MVPQAAGADQNLSFDARRSMLAAFCQAMRLDKVDVVANDSGGGIVRFSPLAPGASEVVALNRLRYA